MRDSLPHMYGNILQLKKLPGCEIVSKSRKGFSAEVTIRDGKYKLRIDYREMNSPKVYIISPEIDITNSLEIHTFGLKYHGSYGRELPLLCLTYHDNDKWDSSISLIKSYIPWAIEWTEFYELWLLTGKWYGKGIHPGGDKKDG